MRLKDLIGRARARKVGKDEVVPVCIVLFLLAIGLSVAMTLGLQACTGGLGMLLIGGAGR